MSSRQKKDPPRHTTHIVRNESSRLGAPVQAVAIHSTESQDLKGTRDDLIGIRNWFDNPISDASAHIGVDGSGNIEKWVNGQRKAWTILQLNPVTCNIEFIGRAAQPRSQWEEAQLVAGAKYAAYWCLVFNLPAQRGNVRNVNGFPVITKKGIITHKDLTDAGFGSHTDPGPAFPMAHFIGLVQFAKKNGWKV